MVPFLAPMLMLVGCPATYGGKSDGFDVDSGDTAGTDDTGDSEDSGVLPGDVAGPDLPDCTAASGNGDSVALGGVVLAPDGPVGGYVVYARSTGKVTCIGADCDLSGAEVVCTAGIVSPGLIDPHNHLQYNTLPPWQVEADFDDRYEWRGDDGYQDYKTAYNAIKDDYSCEIMKWAEARELIHGTTATVGSSGSGCIDLLIRNLDEDSSASHLSDYDINYSASTVTDSEDEASARDANADLANGSLNAAINHVAEGRNGSVQDEIDYMYDIGMVGPGQVFVHASDASSEQLSWMAADGTAIIWSPRSNLALYGTTTPIEIAQRMGVPWAIGTDWTPSGSMSPLGELKCAEEWLHGKGDPVSDVELWGKSTTDAARVVGLDGVLGQLIVGAPADIAVFDWSRTPYRTIIEGTALKVRLVVIGGEAVYGKTTLIQNIADQADWCDAVDVCGDDRMLCLKHDDSGEDGQTLADVQAALETALAAETMPSGYEYAGALYPLFECDAAPTCDLREITGDDADGDGVADASDVCPAIYDPAQWNTDGDADGDACDACPLAADTTDCAISADDPDGDGLANEEDNCPTIGNPDQVDGDGDAKGDACDGCPDEANPGDAPCTATIDAIQAGAFADGSVVTITGAVVTARGDNGFFAQDPALREFGGIYIYDLGANDVAEGDVVSVSGAVMEYYDLTELIDATAVVTGTAPVPEVIVTDACDLAAGVEAWESMLVRVDDVTVTDANPDDPDDYDEFEVNGCLRIDDLVWTDLDQPPGDTVYTSVTGPYTYSFSFWKIAPRRDSDLPQ